MQSWCFAAGNQTLHDHTCFGGASLCCLDAKKGKESIAAEDMKHTLKAARKGSHSNTSLFMKHFYVAWPLDQALVGDRENVVCPSCSKSSLFPERLKYELF